jgi:hypothetical protein
MMWIAPKIFSPFLEIGQKGAIKEFSSIDGTLLPDFQKLMAPP